MEMYVGTILLFAPGWAPAGFALCEGQVINVADNEMLFSLLGNKYGGDGVKTFQLPAFNTDPANPAKYIICMEGLYPSHQ